MYSYEDRIRAVELYIKLGKRVRPTIRQLGYPTKNSLKGAALLELENTYDTRALLTAVDQLDKVLSAVRGQDGLRDMLLRLHRMAQTVINGAGLAGDTGGETLPELAFDTTSELRELIATLQRWVKQIEPLERLQARD